MLNTMKCAAIALSIAALAAGSAGAVTTQTTITFGTNPGGGIGPYSEGTTPYIFTFDSGLLSGSQNNCPFEEPACLLLNPGAADTSVGTLEGNKPFTLLSFDFELAGEGGNPNAPPPLVRNALEVTAITSGVTYIFELGKSAFGTGLTPLTNAFLEKDTPYSSSTFFAPALFEDITSLQFRSLNGGTIRIDNVRLEYETSVIPAPAGVLLIVSALGVAGLVSRLRRTEAAA